MKILLLLLLTSCGIIKTQNEIISVDTNPSGVDVYRKKDNKLLGKTPLFLETEKNSTDLYIFRHDGVIAPEQGQLKEYCDYNGKEKKFVLDEKKERTLDQVIKEINPVHLINDATYECHKGIRADLHFNKVIPPPCKIVVAIPSKNNYLQNSYDIFWAYKNQIFDPKKNSCDKIISPFQAEEYFSYLGIDHMDSPEDLSEMDIQQIFKIGYKFHATHIVFLPYQQKETDIEVSPKLYNIHHGTLEKGPLSQTFSTHLGELDSIWFSNFLFSSFRLIPNGIGFQANTSNKFRATDINQNSISETYDNFEFGITLDDIQYPKEKWSFNFHTVPVFIYTGWGDQFDLQVTGLTLDFKLFIHLPPGGVFVARAGLGGSYIDINYPPTNYNGGGLSFLTDVGLEFYFFPSDRIYAGIGYKRYFLPGGNVEFQGYTLNGESHLFFELGYFWPELRMGARSLFQ